MSVEIIYFVHSTTTDNEAGRATGWLPGELSEKGRQQAAELGVLVATEFDVMITSDLARAVESAELGFGGRFPIIQDKRLRECNYGDLNGTQDAKPDMFSKIDEPYPNGESYEEVEARMRDFLEDIKQQYGGRRVALMAHQAPQLALEVIVNGKTWQEAIESDWRRQGAWQPGWVYIV